MSNKKRNYKKSVSNKSRNIDSGEKIKSML